VVTFNAPSLHITEAAAVPSNLVAPAYHTAASKKSLFQFNLIYNPQKAAVEALVTLGAVIRSVV